MKVKVYVLAAAIEALLSDGTRIAKTSKKETEEQFIARVQEVVKTEHLDDEFEVVRITMESMAENDDSVLKEALPTAEGLQKSMIEQILKARAPKPAKVKEQRSVITKDSEEYKAAEANTGKLVSFSPHKSQEVYEGKIAGVAFNKTATILYYTVVEQNAVRRCCGVLNPTVKFIEAYTNPIEVAPKVAKAAKAAKAEVAQVPAAEVEADELQ